MCFRWILKAVNLRRAALGFFHIFYIENFTFRKRRSRGSFSRFLLGEAAPDRSFCDSWIGFPPRHSENSRMKLLIPPIVMGGHTGFSNQCDIRHFWCFILYLSEFVVSTHVLFSNAVPGAFLSFWSCDAFIQNLRSTSHYELRFTSRFAYVRFFILFQIMWAMTVFWLSSMGSITITRMLFY